MVSVLQATGKGSSPPRRGLDALIDLLHLPEVRKAALAARERFELAQEQILVVNDYKSLHDSFDRLLFRFNVVYREWKRWPADAAYWENVRPDEPEIQNALTDLLDRAQEASFHAETDLWARNLTRAGPALQAAVDDGDLPRFREAMTMLQRVLQLQPTRINSKLVERAKALNLADLVNELESICDRLLTSHPWLESSLQDSPVEGMDGQQRAAVGDTAGKTTEQFREFDVFLAHNSVDKPHVIAIGEELKRRGLKPWLDQEQIPAGFSFQDVIQKAITEVKTSAIFIGPKGLGRWEKLELPACILESVERGLPVIPVLLPGVDEVPPHLLFLKLFNAVRFIHGINDVEAIERLFSGINAVHPPEENRSLNRKLQEENRRHFEEFKLGVADLAEQADQLTSCLGAHDLFQQIDFLLSSIDAQLTGRDASALNDNWPDLQDLIAALSQPDYSRWALKQAKSFVQLVEAYSTNDPARIYGGYWRYRSQVMQSFSIVDQELVANCGNLREYGDQLGRAVEMIQ